MSDDHHAVLRRAEQVVVLRESYVEAAGDLAAFVGNVGGAAPAVDRRSSR
jgi:hypothetical protein